MAGRGSVTTLYHSLSLTAGNESCPQPQTSEHLAAIEIMKLKHIIILQNKIDLIRDTQAKDQYQEILKFVQGSLEWWVGGWVRYGEDSCPICFDWYHSGTPKDTTCNESKIFLQSNNLSQMCQI